MLSSANFRSPVFSRTCSRAEVISDGSRRMSGACAASYICFLRAATFSSPMSAEMASRVKRMESSMIFFTVNAPPAPVISAVYLFPSVSRPRPKAAPALDSTRMAVCPLRPRASSAAPFCRARAWRFPARSIISEVFSAIGASFSDFCGIDLGHVVRARHFSCRLRLCRRLSAFAGRHVCRLPAVLVRPCGRRAVFRGIGLRPVPEKKTYAINSASPSLCAGVRRPAATVCRMTSAASCLRRRSAKAASRSSRAFRRASISGAAAGGVSGLT